MSNTISEEELVHVRWDGPRSRYLNYPLSLVLSADRTWLGFYDHDLTHAVHRIYYAVDMIQNYVQGHGGGIGNVMAILPFQGSSVVRSMTVSNPAVINLSELLNKTYANDITTKYKSIVAPSPIILGVPSGGVDMREVAHKIRENG